MVGADFICPCCGAGIRLYDGWNLVKYGSNATGQCYHSVTPNTGPSPHYFTPTVPIPDENPKLYKQRSWNDDKSGPWDASPKYKRWQTSRSRRNPKHSSSTRR